MAPNTYKLLYRPTMCRFFMQLVFILVLLNSASFSQPVNLKAYSGIAKTFSRFTGDPIILHKQGIFLNPLYDHSNPDQGHIDAAQFNRMLKPSFIYNETSNDLATLYSNILTNEQWAILPLLPAQVIQQNKLRAFLYNNDGTPKPGYKLYLEKKKAWEEIDEIYQQTPEAERTPDLEVRHQTLQDEFELVRPQYQPSENLYKHLDEQSSLNWRDVDIQNLSKYRISAAAGQYLITSSYPALNEPERLNWSTVKISASQLRQTDPLSKLSGNVDASTLQWWQWSDESDVDVNICRNDLESADFTVQFDIAIANIKRDWLDQKLFESSAWRWKSGSTELISDGEEDKNKGVSPAFPNSILLVRSVRISGPDVLPCLPYLRKAAASRHPVSFGPFRLSGSTPAPVSFYLPPTVTQTAIQATFPQILGYGVTILPKTPNSNPNFVWPDK